MVDGYGLWGVWKWRKCWRWFMFFAVDGRELWEWFYRPRRAVPTTAVAVSHERVASAELRWNLGDSSNSGPRSPFSFRQELLGGRSVCTSILSKPH